MGTTKKKNKPATLKDVAMEAGVSAMAVSNALNHRGGVSPETQKKIEEAARKLNYTPNRVAQSLRSSKTYTIGVVMSDSSQYVFSKLLQGIGSAASEAGYSVLLASTGQDREGEGKAIDLLVSKRIDGLLMAAPMGSDAQDIARIKELDVPFVFLMRTPNMAGADYVANNNLMGGYRSVQHLYETGSRDLFFITLDSSSGRERIIGYQQFLGEVGERFDRFYSTAVRPTIDDGYAAMKEILGKGHARGAVCCGCDMIAIGAMNAILEAGLGIPQDFRLIGYDDFELTQYLRVPLSTVRQPVFDIGAEGVQLLLKRMDSPDIPYQSVILQPELIIRESTGKVETPDSLSN